MLFKSKTHWINQSFDLLRTFAEDTKFLTQNSKPHNGTKEFLQSKNYKIQHANRAAAFYPEPLSTR